MRPVNTTERKMSPEALAFLCMQRALARTLPAGTRPAYEARRLHLASRLIAGPAWGLTPQYPARPAQWPEGCTHLQALPPVATAHPQVQP